MSMAAVAKEVCKHYTQRIVARDKTAWLDLWADDNPQLVIAYGRGGTPPFCSERYVGKESIGELIFGATHKLEPPWFGNDRIFLIEDPPGTFFWQFELEIRTRDGFQYRNHLMCKITLEGNKIKELVEYGDPRRRGDFFYYLENMQI